MKAQAETYILHRGDGTHEDDHGAVVTVSAAKLVQKPNEIAVLDRNKRQVALITVSKEFSVSILGK